MTTFNLGEVRDSFVADMTRFLSQIEESARKLVAAAPPAEHIDKLGKEQTDNIGVSLHTIGGTSSLLAIESILGAARRMEALTATVNESLRMVSLHSGVLRQIGNVWIEGAVALRAMMKLELEGKSSDAMARQKVLLARIDRVGDGKQQLQAASGEAESDGGWDDHGDLPKAPQPLATQPGIPAVEDELVEVFREEAREAITGLRGLVIKLQADPADGQSSSQVARLLHLLKGAAASVQMTNVATYAKELHGPIEARNETATPLDAKMVEVLRDGVEKLAAMALPVTAPSTSAPPSYEEPPSQMEGDDDALDLFRGEALRILADAEPLLRDVKSSSGPGRAEALKRLERLFHRLKGSALVVGQDSVGATAAQIQALCEPGPSVFDPVELQMAVNAIRAELKAPAPPPSGSMPVAPMSRPSVQQTKVTITTGELWEAFLGEAAELCDEIDRILNTIDRTSDPRSGLRTLLRHYHTLKGAANTAGLAPMGAEIHVVETFLEKETEAKVLSPLGLVASALGDVQRRMRKNLVRAQQQGVVDAGAAQVQYVLSNLGATSHAPSTVAPSTGSWLGSGDPAWSSQHDSSASQIGSSRRASSRDESEAGSEMTEGVERRYIRVPVERLDGLMNMVGELVVSRSRMVARLEALKNIYADDDGRRKNIVTIVDAFAAQNAFAGIDGKSKMRRGKKAAGDEGAEASTQGLDHDTDVHAKPVTPKWMPEFGALEMDTYEEIHILSRRLTEAANDVSESAAAINTELVSLADDADTISGIVSGLQGEITRARMVPLETVFSRLYLPVRDAATREAKGVDVITRGETVAIDKAMADALYGPMLHLVRNSVAHGVESEEVRRRNGKPPRGTIALSARQESGQIIIEVSDDGAGVDTERLRKVGIERGLLSPGISADDPAVLDLMFVSGVSTSKQVGDVAGRGVGCDVVRRAVERLNGDIRATTTRGVGTVFTISLPLTMSITQAVMVRDGDRVLAIPMHFAERIVEPDPNLILTSLDRRRINVEGELLPMRSAAELFGEQPHDNVGAILVCVVGDNAFALEVESVVAQEEIVVKHLGEVLHGHPLFAGVTLRGDGELALILDVPSIMTTVVERAASMPQVIQQSAPAAQPMMKERAELHPLAAPKKGGAASEAPSADASARAPGAAGSAAAGSTASAPAMAAGSVAQSTDGAKPVAPVAPGRPGAPGAKPTTPPPVPAPKGAIGAKAATPGAAPTAPAHAKGGTPVAPGTKPGVGTPGAKGPATPPPVPGKVPPIGGKKPDAPAVQPTGPIKVLFVDDSLSVRKVAEKALQSIGGLDVTTAVDGQDALEQLRVNTFDLVFTDLEMPRLHGFELIREMRFVPAYQNIPVVVVSSRSGAKHIEHAISMGASEYLTKPFTAEGLAQAIKKWVKRGGS
ncbi:MAG: Hpt domain-containing protein [Kofleriaceae bacterium]